MKLVDNWRAILRKAWSVLWMYAAMVFEGAGLILVMFQPDPTAALRQKLIFGALTLLAVLLGIIGRVIEQKELTGGK